MKFKMIALAALLSGVLGTATANQVILMNGSMSPHPFSITYKLAYKNPNGPVIFGQPQKITLTRKPEIVRFTMHNFQLAGLVVESVAGHMLPSSANQFDKPRQCSMTTNHRNDTGSITLDWQKLPNNHGRITCASHGGIFG